MNRIVAASVVTAIFMVIGTWTVFHHRMPFSFYIIGAFFQFVFVTFTRFGNRLWTVEKRKFKNWRKTGRHVMIVGAAVPLPG